MQINDPAVLAELKGCHEVYEKALIDNDVAVLDSLFWDSPYSLRFGVGENLHGAEEIRAFRKGRPKINLNRDIQRLDIVTFGDSVGIVNLEYARPVDGITQYGRQTQFWFRFPEGWRIASAHVSVLPADSTYLKAAASEIGLRISAANAGGVNEDLKRVAAIAGFLMQFPLDPGVEAAPVFQP